MTRITGSCWEPGLDTCKTDLVRRLLFKSRNIVKENRRMWGGLLLMIFLDIIDLFERIMTSQQDYRMWHHFFGRCRTDAECSN